MCGVIHSAHQNTASLAVAGHLILLPPPTFTEGTAMQTHPVVGNHSCPAPGLCGPLDPILCVPLPGSSEGAIIVPPIKLPPESLQRAFELCISAPFICRRCRRRLPPPLSPFTCFTSPARRRVAAVCVLPVPLAPGGAVANCAWAHNPCERTAGTGARHMRRRMSKCTSDSRIPTLVIYWTCTGQERSKLGPYL